MAWTKKLRAEQVDVSGGGDNVTRYIFNDLQETTSTSNTVVRQFNIGTLADVKMIRINAEYERLVNSGAFTIELFDPLTTNTVLIKGQSVGLNYARYYQYFFLNPSLNEFIPEGVISNYSFAFNGSAPVTYDPTVNYDVRVLIRTFTAGGTMIDRGLLIEIYK